MAVISFCIRSAIPGYMVEPPDRTVLAYKSFRMSMSPFMMADNLHSDEGRAEHRFRAAEPFVSDGNNLSVGQLVRLFGGGGGSSGGHFLLEVKGDVAELLLDVTDNLALGGGDNRIASLRHDFHEIIRQVASGQVETQDGMGEGVTLVDGDGVGDAIADVQDQTGGTTRGVERKHGLNADIHSRVVESLEAKLRHLFSFRLGVERGFRVESW